MDQVSADMVIGGTRYVFAERLERAEARIQAVRELHEWMEMIGGDRHHRKYCSECSFDGPYVDWPCDTLRALDGDGDD